jgi:hypothetical protein
MNFIELKNEENGDTVLLEYDETAVTMKLGSGDTVT